jgi:bifunctional non-homologous end joining protein LigD
MSTGLPPLEFPEWIEPMAATLTQERFVGPEWTFERKFDGIRLVAFKQGDVVRLYSRTRKEKALPEIAAAVAALPVDDVILDGEVEWDGHTASRLRRRMDERP